MLDQRLKAGCTSRNLSDFENGNGSNVGREIKRLIRRAKRILKEPQTNTKLSVSAGLNAEFEY